MPDFFRSAGGRPLPLMNRLPAGENQNSVARRRGIPHEGGQMATSGSPEAAKSSAGILHALLEAAEREQRRIGQELHDHLCQHLLGAAFAAKALAGAMDREQSRLAPQLHDLARLINDAVTQVRDISRGLHPVELDSAGLLSALRELANRASHSVSCTFRCGKDVPVNDPATALNAYRIAQEAVACALQTGAAKILLALTRKGDSICLRITDDGRIEGPLTADSSGTVARTLYYRSQAMGGELTMLFNPGAGTSVTCIFPFKK